MSHVSREGRNYNVYVPMQVACIVLDMVCK